MQEIKYEDGTKERESFGTLEEAIENAGEKAKKKKIKRLTITRIIPNKKGKKRR